MTHTPGSLWNALARHAAAHAERTAVRTPTARLLHGELLAQAEGLAGELARRAAPGQVVALALPNTIDFAAVVLAAWKAELVVALVSSRYGTQEVHDLLRGVPPALVVTTPTVASRWAGVLDLERAAELPSSDERIVAVRPLERAEPCAHAETALIKFTSGSTAEPKGIALSPANVLAECESVVAGLDLTADDRLLCPVPISHSYGFDLGLLAALRSGASLSLRDAFVPRPVMRGIADEGVTVLLGVPSMYRFCVDMRWSSVPDLSSLRFALSCTAPLAPELIEAFHERFGVAVCQHYGSSEAGAVTTHAPDSVLARTRSVGRAMRDVTLAVVDPSGRELAAGERGELLVRGPAVAKGYVLGAPPEPLPLRDGGFRTGDLARIDAEGFLYIEDRIDGLINVGGLKVSPTEVQRALEAHPGVSEAAVLGVREAGGGEGVYALVVGTVPGKGVGAVTVTGDELIAYCRERLAEYKVPRRIRVAAELPRGPSGKVRVRAEDVLQ